MDLEVVVRPGDGVAVMGVAGFEQRWWPLSSVWACATIGTGWYAVLGTTDTVLKSRNKIRAT